MFSAICCLAAAEISGELKQWHKVTLTVEGPQARERDREPNPFTDYRMTVRFRHESGSPEYRVPGYFAADGRAGESSAEEGNKWRAHLSPDKAGEWSWRVEFVKGEGVALKSEGGSRVEPVDGLIGSFRIAETDKRGRDLRGKGRLEYVNGHYLRFAGTGDYFLKAGPDSPENLFGYVDFDGTRSHKHRGSVKAGEAAPMGLHSYEGHVKDWREGDPTWKGGKGKGLIGAINYLDEKGMNAFSFLTYNAGGDGDDVWPFIERDAKLHYDCSKLDQWQVVLDHAQSKGFYLHFKMQEQEIDDNRVGDNDRTGNVPVALDGGNLGMERKLYCRELIARFGYLLALNWNLGEENTQSEEQQKAMAGYIAETDPYKHNIVVHTFPGWQDRVYSKLLGKDSPFTGASLQNGWSQAHQRTLKWVRESAKAGKPWVVANDEQGPANQGVPPDPGYQGHSGKAKEGQREYDMHDIRKYTLWGTLMAGGAGVEYYFGYQLPQNDLQAEDWRSRDRSWDYARHALDFFHNNNVPFWEMTNADELVGNGANRNGKFCFAKPGTVYVVYLPEGGTTELDIGEHGKAFQVHWFNPREGGALGRGGVRSVRGPGKVSLGDPPGERDQDWAVLVRAE